LRLAAQVVSTVTETLHIFLRTRVSPSIRPAFPRRPLPFRRFSDHLMRMVIPSERSDEGPLVKFYSLGGTLN